MSDVPGFPRIMILARDHYCVNAMRPTLSGSRVFHFTRRLDAEQYVAWKALLPRPTVRDYIRRYYLRFVRPRREWVLPWR